MGKSQRRSFIGPTAATKVALPNHHGLLATVYKYLASDSKFRLQMKFFHHLLPTTVHLQCFFAHFTRFLVPTDCKSCRLPPRIMCSLAKVAGSDHNGHLWWGWRASPRSRKVGRPVKGMMVVAARAVELKLVDLRLA